MSSPEVDVKELAAALWGDALAIARKWHTLRGQTVTPEAVSGIVIDVTRLVEKASTAYPELTSAQKKDLARQLVAQVLDEIMIKIKLPGVGGWLVGFLWPVLRDLVIDWAIDHIVAAFNASGVFKHKAQEAAG